MEITPGTGSGRAEYKTHIIPSAAIRVLVVDDELATRKLLGAIFSEAGLSCKDAASAEDGLAVLERESVDAVVSDLQMPGGSGMEFLRPIINQDQLKRVVNLLHDLLEPRIEDCYVFFFVVKWHYDGILRHINSLDAHLMRDGYRTIPKNRVKALSIGNAE